MRLIILFILLSNIATAGTYRQLNVTRYLKYSVKYEKTIVEASEKHSIDKDMIKAVISKESNWAAKAIGTGNCKSLMQVQNGPTDPHRSIKAGTAMLARLYKKYGDWRVALSCYNRGERGFRRLNTTTTKYAESVLAYCEQIKTIDRCMAMNYCYKVGLI
jgi:soluble lytic murein transglycosylase-like protein